MTKAEWVAACKAALAAAKAERAKAPEQSADEAE
jgi:hypothetical protein